MIQPAHLASTVILLRDGKAGLETFFVKRGTNTSFASGALVFPGGKVDASDFAEGWGTFCDGVEMLTVEEGALRVAALRELFEESGVLLARKKPMGSLLSGEEVLAFHQERKLIHAGKLGWLEFLQEHQLRLACDLLVLFAHWIAPKLAPKRYDTSFFLVDAPDDQEGLHDGSELVDSLWLGLEEALEAAEKEMVSMIFPTRMNVEKLALSKTVEEALFLAQHSDVVTVMPWIEQHDVPMLCIPMEAGYPRHKESLMTVMRLEGRLVEASKNDS